MSLSMDFSPIMGMASTIVNGLWVVFLIPIGIGLGMKLLMAIVTAIKSAV